jgi:hypothetical protein
MEFHDAEALDANVVARTRAVHDTLKAANAPRARVAVVSDEPWVPALVKRAGGIYVALHDAPDVLVVTDARTGTQNAARVFIVQPQLLTSTPGAHLALAVEVLAALFNPQLFPPVDPALARAV